MSATQCCVHTMMCPPPPHTHTHSQKFGMTDIAPFGITFESHDLFTPTAAPADGAAVAKTNADPGHVLKSLLPAGVLVCVFWHRPNAAQPTPL
jgi:hypothetical protein